MEEAIAQLADDRDEAEARRDTALLQKEDLQSRIAELEQHIEQTQDKLQVRNTLCLKFCSIITNYQGIAFI